MVARTLQEHYKTGRIDLFVKILCDFPNNILKWYIFQFKNKNKTILINLIHTVY